LKRSTAVKRGWTFSRAWRALSRRAGGGRRFGVLILLGLLVAIGLAVAMCERAEEKVQFHLRTEIPTRDSRSARSSVLTQPPPSTSVALGAASRIVLAMANAP
jgi:hypothetical protein